MVEISVYCSVCKESMIVPVLGTEDTASGRKMYVAKCPFCSTKLLRLSP